MRLQYVCDKSAWMDGPWHTEPDHATWIHSATSYPCLARRNLFGAWCGYVGLDEGHPLFFSEVGCSEFQFIDIHGTISMAGYFHQDAILFTPPRKLWFVGFDCMQENDLCPYFESEAVQHGMKKKGRNAEIIVYRDWDYVLREIDSLAMQLGNFDQRFIL